MEPLLEVSELTTKFYTSDGVVNAVNGISYKLFNGETLAIVGESGCGKSVGVMSLLRLIAQPLGKITHGRALFKGVDLLQMDMNDIRKIRGNKVGMIFQDPMTSLNPVLTIGRQMTETLELHLQMSREQAICRSIELLDKVGIPNAKDRLQDYPYQFSGGMRQRVMIAMGLSCSPELLIADEPTTALDVTIQAQIIDLVKRLQAELGMSMIWISHDLGVVAGLADRVIVMYGGYIVEDALVSQLYENPCHPYTKGLLASLPRLDAAGKRVLTSIEGFPPNLYDLPQGCPFEERCNQAKEFCGEKIPELVEIAPGHLVACHAF